MSEREELRQAAQDKLLSAMQTAFDGLGDDPKVDPDGSRLRAEMSKQMARVEGLFGVERYSYRRGG